MSEASLTAPAASGELIKHEWNEAGVCTNPEEIRLVVPAKKDRAELTLFVAVGDDGLWRFGYNWTEGASEGACPVKASEPGFAERGEALREALKRTAVAFNNHKRATAAIEAFLDTLKAAVAAGSPANAAAGEVAPKRERIAYKTEFAEVPVGKIQRNPMNHRKHFDGAELHELANSLREEGLHQPIGLRRLLEGEVPEGQLPLGDPGATEFELIYGERRWRAAQLASIETLQAKIYNGLRREQTHAIALIENLQRAGINAMEEADGYAELMAAEGLTQEEAAARVGKERSTVANTLRLRALPAPVREAIGEGKLTKAHGIALARFVPSEKEAADFPKWAQVVQIMAEEAIENKTPAGSMERGVPSSYRLRQAGLAEVIGWYSEPKMPDKLKRHAAYFSDGDGDWVCLHPEHWRAYVREYEQAKKEKAERAAEKARAEAEKLSKRGERVLDLAELKSDQFKVVDHVQSETERAALSLVPEKARAQAKEGNRNVTVVTDVELAERLSAAMVRAIKKDRRAKVEELRKKVATKIAKIKKVGPRELAWLVFLVVDTSGRSVYLHLEKDAVKEAGVKLPRGAAWSPDNENAWEGEEDAPHATGERRLAALSKCEGPDLVKALITERLEKALEEIVEGGPKVVGASMVRWWLESDTLWLLEETEEGRAELVEQVKAAPWYGKEVAGAQEGAAESEEAAAEGVAFDGREKGRVVDFDTREVAEAYLDSQRKREGFEGYETTIEKVGNTFVVAYEKRTEPKKRGKAAGKKGGKGNE